MAARQVRRPAVKRPRTRGRQQRFTLERFSRLETPAILFLIALYCAVHAAISVLVLRVYAEDAAAPLLLSQSFRLGYSVDTPPLLTWLYAGLDAVDLLRRPAVIAVKYVTLGAGLAIFYLAARNILQRRDLSAAALAAWALSVAFGWQMHGLSVSGVLLFSLSAGVLHAVTRILTWRRRRDWTYLGVMIGLGCLAHGQFLLFPLALLASVLMSPFFRDAVRLPWLSVTVLVALLVYAPHGVWLLKNLDRAAAHHVEAVTGFGDAVRMVLAAPMSALGFVGRVLAVTLPLAMAWLMLFWSLWLPILYPVFARRSTDQEPHEAAWRGTLARSVLIGLVPSALLALAGAGSASAIALLPVFLALPIWMFLHVKRAGEFPVAIRAFAALAIGCMIAAAADRVASWRLGADACADTDSCSLHLDMDGYAQALQKAGFEGGTIVGDDPVLTANLRMRLRQARVVETALPASAFPSPSASGACLAVWRGPPEMPEALYRRLVDDLASDPGARMAEGAINRSYTSDDRQSETLYYLFSQPSAYCR